MMFSKKDLQINSVQEALEFAPILIFCALVAPFVLVAYKLGFIMDKIGWLNSK